MKEYTTRGLRTIDGPSASLIFTLIESEGILYVSIKAGDDVHVVDAVHFMWAASDIRNDMFKKIPTMKGGDKYAIRSKHSNYRE